MTNNLHQSENDSLDEPLEEFINKMTNNDPSGPNASVFTSEATAEDKDLNLDSFTYKESTYYHPAINDIITYTLTDFPLMFQREKVSSRKRKKHFVLPKTPEHEIRLLLSGDDILLCCIPNN